MRTKILLFTLIFALYSLAEVFITQDILMFSILCMTPFAKLSKKTTMFVVLLAILAVLKWDSNLIRLGLILLMLGILNSYFTRYSKQAEDVFYFVIVGILLLNLLSLLPGLDMTMNELTSKVINEESLNLAGAITRDASYYSFIRPRFLTSETSYAVKIVLVGMFMVRRNIPIILISAILIFRSPMLIIGFFHPLIFGKLNLRSILFTGLAAIVILSSQYDRLIDLLAFKDLSSLQRIFVPIIGLMSWKSLSLGTVGVSLYTQQWVLDYLPEYMLNDGYVAPHIIRVIIEWGILGILYLSFIIRYNSIRALVAILLFGLTSDLSYTPYPWVLLLIFIHGNLKLEKIHS